MKTFLKKSWIVLILTSTYITVLADDSANLIVNPYFEATDGVVTDWGQRESGALESYIDPADSEKCGEMKFTYLNLDGKLVQSTIYQLIPDLFPGDYILSFSSSGEDLKGIYAVVRFQEVPGNIPESDRRVLGKFTKWIGVNEMPEKGKWKRFVFKFKVTEGSQAGLVAIEMFGEPEAKGKGRVLIKNVRLEKQASE